jgi:hypothetical protein
MRFLPKSSRLGAEDSDVAGEVVASEDSNRLSPDTPPKVTVELGLVHGAAGDSVEVGAEVEPEVEAEMLTEGEEGWKLEKGQSLMRAEKKPMSAKQEEEEVLLAPLDMEPLAMHAKGWQ